MLNEMNRTENPLSQTFVALDLETTGLDSAKDTIIEIGAVKFVGDEIIDSFQTFINPGRTIPEFVQRLTGISPNQVRRAPFFSSIVAELESFLGPYPIIGHNISFDLRFLESHGLPLRNPNYDTWDLASIFLPNSNEYSLSYLSQLLGINHNDAHRALADAQATRGVFLTLLKKAAGMDPNLVGSINNQAIKSHWAVSTLLDGLLTDNQNQTVRPLGMTGLDLDNLSSRLFHKERPRTPSTLSTITEHQIETLLSSGGPFTQKFSGFENRPEQVEMLRATTQAIFRGNHLIVEGGTGVGKSMAYLLPAVLFSASTGNRVVISTNTINLQEQLLNKDIPILKKILESARLIDEDLIQAAPLKGRSNYLCLRRWDYLSKSDAPSIDEARLLGKTSVWLQETSSGDRSEINLGPRDIFGWNKISAGEKTWCPGLKDGETCFLRSAREKAEQAHIVVVNHALLLSDLAHGGTLIPDYKHLIVDEAHHLEDEATRQFGFQVGQEHLVEEAEQLSRLTNQLQLYLATSENLPSGTRTQGDLALAEVQSITPRLRETWGRLWSASEQFLTKVSESKPDDSLQLLLTTSIRTHPAWNELVLTWENMEVVFTQAVNRIAQIHKFLESNDLGFIEDKNTLALESSRIMDDFEQLNQRLKSILGQPDDKNINWISRHQQTGALQFHSAPLDISPIISDDLLADKESVIFTSATLATEGNFGYFRSQTGIPDESKELLVGSPFDYQKAALLLIPEDMPPPSADGYLSAMSRVLIDLGKSLRGSTLALFTSYSNLRSVSQLIREPLMADGIQVLAQSIDGSPQQLMRRFQENPESVLLGTSSFWEGVDFTGNILKSLVLTRLPFQVPTDPIVKARSDQYPDAFQQYSVPQAVLKFRQGIGRLIRNKEDKGTIVVLDKRITGRSYGQAFLRSIPPCNLQPSTQATVGTLAARWIRDGNAI